MSQQELFVAVGERKCRVTGKTATIYYLKTGMDEPGMTPVARDGRKEAS